MQLSINAHVLTLISLAIAPGLAIAIYIYWKDKFHREPRRLMIQSFLLGIFSIFPAVWLEKHMAGWLHVKVHSDSLADLAVYAYVVIGLTEEFCKFFFTWNYFYGRDEFDEPYDGITYSVMVAMGFATIENVFYVMDSDGGIKVALLRMVTAVPAHGSFAVVMGYFLGLAKFNAVRRGWLLLYSIVVPAFFHGTYDFCLMQENSLLVSLGAIFTLILVIRLSYIAIKLHQESSPYNPKNTKHLDEERDQDSA